MRKVFLEDLLGGNRKNIDCSLLEGKDVRFIYDELEGYINILDCGYIFKSNRRRFYLTVKYKENMNYIDIYALCKGNIGNLLGIYTKSFKTHIGTTFEDKNRNITIIDREIRQTITKNNKIHNYKHYKYSCNVCNYNEGWIEESNLLHHKKGCSVCAGISILEDYNDIPTTAPWMIPYFQGGYEEAKLYTKNSGKRITPICPDCGRIKDKSMSISTIYNSSSIGCSCSDKISYPNKFSYSLLDQLNKIYNFDYLEREYSPEWIGRKSYDNYFIYNGEEYILEMDGEFHFKDNYMSGQTKEESKLIDDYKDKLAKEHSIKAIRINCYYRHNDRFLWVKQNIINSYLSNLFDLNVIDWNKCNEYACSNLIKEICNYWKEGIHSTNDIAKITKLNRSTVIIYLTFGSGVWCDYNAKEEKIKASRKSGKKNGKPVLCIETGQIFESASDCARQSEKVFGVKISQGGVLNACKKDTKNKTGYTFRKVS